uniref:Uncharacterized protein n=1 Tax=Tetranychus urticae TaxID=32264 RepID=T1JWZ1_TETUR
MYGKSDKYCNVFSFVNEFLSFLVPIYYRIDITQLSPEVKIWSIQIR